MEICVTIQRKSESGIRENTPYLITKYIENLRHNYNVIKLI